MSTILQGKSTFALGKVIRRLTSYLEKAGQLHQIKYLPVRYPQHLSELSEIDIIPKSKILKAHLEDAFGTNRFSVQITRKKTTHTIKITHDSMQQEEIVQIAALYANSENLIFERF